MFLKTDFFAPRAHTSWWTSGGLLAAALLTGCTLPAAPQLAPDATPTTATPAAANPGNPASPAVAAQRAPASEALLQALAYADRVRTLSAAELGQEVARLNHPVVPLDQLQLALALSQSRQTSELTRVQELLSRLLANADAQAQPLHPLARLLATRYSEQRRLEDLLDKQTQQTRDVQRRLEQTQDRLEALKAIERSLTSRPHLPAAQAPASRTRPPAP